MVNSLVWNVWDFQIHRWKCLATTNKQMNVIMDGDLHFFAVGQTYRSNEKMGFTAKIEQNMFQYCCNPIMMKRVYSCKSPLIALQWKGERVTMVNST